MLMLMSNVAVDGMEDDVSVSWRQYSVQDGCIRSAGGNVRGRLRARRHGRRPLPGDLSPAAGSDLERASNEHSRGGRVVHFAGIRYPSAVRVRISTGQCYRTEQFGE